MNNLKKLLAIIFLGLMWSVSVYADWFELSISENATLYYNPKSMTKDQNTKFIWVLIDQKKELSGSMSRKVHLEIDCKKGKFKMHQLNMYEDNLGGGDIVGKVNKENELGGWRSAIPGSTLYPVLKVACE